MLFLQSEFQFDLMSLIMTMYNQKGMREIIICCQMGMNRSQTMAAVLKKKLATIRLDKEIIINVVSLEMVPGMNKDGLYIGSTLCVAGDFFEEKTDGFIEEFGFDRQHTLSLNLSLKAREDIKNKRSVAFLDDAIFLKNDDLLILADKWKEYASSVATPRLIISMTQSYENRLCALNSFFDNSLVIALDLPDLIVHPNRSKNESGLKQMISKINEVCKLDEEPDAYHLNNTQNIIDDIKLTEKNMELLKEYLPPI